VFDRRIEVSGSEALKIVDQVGEYLKSRKDSLSSWLGLAPTLRSLLDSLKDLADAATTRVNLDTEADSEAKFKDKLSQVKNAELDARLAAANALKAKADAEFRRADRSWRHPQQQKKPRGETMREGMSQGTKTLKRDGFTNDTLKTELQKAQTSP